jgi:hypothetical protein
MTQNDRLLHYLDTHDGIDPLTAWSELGIYRLGARVFDLKKRGINIKTEDKTVYNRFNEPCVVAWYKIQENT